MKKVIGYLLLLGLVISSACQKESAEPAPDFVKGMVIAGIKDGTTTAKAFRFADSLNLPITQMSGFFYRSSLPNDSVAYVKRVLLAKPYLNKKGFTGDNVRINVVTKQFEVLNLFFDMDLASQQDWLATMQQLQLSPLGNSTAYVMLQVPEGHEQLWLAKLSSSSIVKWVELNYIGQLKLL